MHHDFDVDVDVDVDVERRAAPPVRDALWPDGNERLRFAQRSTGLGLLIATADLAGVMLLIALAVSPLPLLLNLLAAVSAGVLIGTLFTVGHDALHQSLTPSRALNDWVGRVAFMPAAHARSLWILSHNKIHHSYTNLRGRDYVWEPLSLEAYRRASPVRRAIYRLSRSPVGAFPYYLIEMWWAKHFMPIAAEARAEWRKHLPDSVFALLSWLCFGAAVGWLGGVLAPTRPLWETLLLGWILPFLLFNWLIGWIVYVHHTHPEAPWWDDVGEWRAGRPQITGTVQVRLPLPLHAVSNNIMDHNAHHAAPDIPLYRLHEAQTSLRGRLAAIRHYYMTPLAYLRIVAACKLYDATTHRWTDFNGRPTGPVLDSALRAAISGLTQIRR